jgi:hypothetical protein
MSFFKRGGGMADVEFPPCRLGKKASALDVQKKKEVLATRLSHMFLL